MKLNVATWKYFQLSEIFTTIEPGKVSQAYQLEEGNDIPYLGAKKEDNGVMSWCASNPDLTSKGNCVILICDGQGSVGYANYMESDFLGTVNLMLCYNNRYMNRYVGLFLATILSQERPKYSFGRKWKTHLNDTIIKLPQNFDGNPDWDFMEQYIKSLNHKPLTTANQGGYGSHTLGVESWKEFCVGDLFEVKKGKRLTSDEQTDGETPYIGAIDSNNGVANYIGQAAIHDGNTISLSYNGSVGEAFYQPRPFLATDDVNVLYFKEENGIAFNKYIALFICAVLRQEKYRYSYGRKWVLESMRSTVIKLPAKDNKPDFGFMENYMRALPYGDRI